MSRILLTGGFGYIGSHTVVKLLEMNKSIIILDNFSSVDYGVINRIKKRLEYRLFLYKKINNAGPLQYV